MVCYPISEKMLVLDFVEIKFCNFITMASESFSFTECEKVCYCFLVINVSGYFVCLDKVTVWILDLVAVDS